MEIPFGKYKGTPLNEVPTDYLVELRDTNRKVLKLFPDVKEQIVELLKKKHEKLH
jgi:uncharacterized protein (DUF3820 family)